MPAPDAAVDMADALLQVLRLRVRDMQCAIDLALVERVFPLMELQQVPGGADHLAGLMNCHGVSLAVVDLGIWLGMADAEPYSLDTPVVLCGDGQVRVGFVVSHVVGVDQAAVDNIQMRTTFEGGELPFVAALNSASGQALLLDMRRILRLNFSAPSSCLAAPVQLPAAESAA